jgi:phosphatidylserine decarboxylase
MSFTDRLFAALQRVLPHHALSALMYRVTRIGWRPFKNAFIRVFCRLYRVDLQQAERGSAEDYRHFNDFFTRALKAGARPLVSDPAALACPVDGCVSQLGAIRDQALLQAKDHDFSLTDLLGGDHRLAETYRDGLFATIYLSPRDYHRIHMPLDGSLRGMLHVPGRLFSVNAATTRALPGLFARNERLICLFENRDIGPFCVILVGALFVASMQTVWAGEVTPRNNGGEIGRWDYRGDQQLQLARGTELGRFNMGSTVILLLPRGSAAWHDELRADQTVRMGQDIGRITPVR